MIAQVLGNGVLLVDKPPGWSSTDVVRQLKLALRLDKAGHAGPLDVGATGLLIILLGACRPACLPARLPACPPARLGGLRGLLSRWAGLVARPCARRLEPSGGKRLTARGPSRAGAATRLSPQFEPLARTYTGTIRCALQLGWLGLAPARLLETLAAARTCIWLTRLLAAARPLLPGSA